MIKLIPITVDDKNLLENWLDSDTNEELRSYKDFSAWFKLLNTLNRWGWIIEDNGSKIGFIDLEKNLNNEGYFSFYLSPVERGKGRSKNILLYLIQKAEELNLSLLKAGVNNNNIPSQKSLESIGFVQEGVAKDGYLTYLLPIHSSKASNH